MNDYRKPPTTIEEIEAEMVLVEPFEDDRTLENDMVFAGWSDKERSPELSKLPYDGIYVNRFLVTQALWEEVLGKRRWSFAHPEKPATGISYEDCIEFLEVLNKRLETKDKDAFRLPYVKEWRFVAFGGKYRDKYFSPNVEEAAIIGNNSFDELGHCALKYPNLYGLYDMGGNATEWCQFFPFPNQSKWSYPSVGSGYNSYFYSSDLTDLDLPPFGHFLLYRGLSGDRNSFRGRQGLRLFRSYFRDVN
ncbi:MAG: SUMF1/EgtB/PvdO family nonheme iron enzyme [Bacteroidota bacterium]